ncbi:hypothetical protein ACFOWX_03585 [Sphingorhabdus arenilitoris]|uniref:Transposase n=1 Tax=Sphingorhabdus arenilitoris TaxID=1490041 RepID=A0ABV8RGS9_9SPHN
MSKNSAAKRGQASKSVRIGAAKREVFLAQLAETSNVTASARAAGVSSSAIYTLRRRSAEFRDQWAAALTEGYAKLEAAMLEEALQAASAATSDAMLKSRAQKHRLRLALLNAHRASVKSLPDPRITPEKQPDGEAIKAKLIAKLSEMRRRMEEDITKKDNIGLQNG